jgi:hypothetical protein
MPGEARPNPPVHVLEVGEEALIEEADLVEEAAPVGGRPRAGGQDVAGAGELGPIRLAVADLGREDPKAVAGGVDPGPIVVVQHL